MPATERRQQISHLIAANRTTPDAVMNDHILSMYKPIIDVMARDGLTAKQAAISLGIQPPPGWVVSNTQFRRAVDIERKAWEQAYDITRRDVVNGIMSGIDIAKSTGDAASVVRGWVEIGKLCGLNAPQRVEVKAEVTHETSMKDLQRLTDEQLLQLIANQSPTIEGEVVSRDSK